MTTLVRNFLYAVALTALFFLHSADANTVTIGDLVRLAQSPVALQAVVAVSFFLMGLDLLGRVGQWPGVQQDKVPVKGFDRD